MVVTLCPFAVVLELLICKHETKCMCAVVRNVRHSSYAAPPCRAVEQQASSTQSDTQRCCLNLVSKMHRKKKKLHKQRQHKSSIYKARLRTYIVAAVPNAKTKDHRTCKHNMTGQRAGPSRAGPTWGGKAVAGQSQAGLFPARQAGGCKLR